MQQRNFEPIAIVGIACRFPSANNSDEFWELLKNGKNAVVEVPADRWDIDLFYNSTPETSGKMNTKYGGFIEEVERIAGVRIERRGQGRPRLDGGK